MEFFQTLGSVISGRWKARNYNEEAFPEIASQTVMELPPAQHVSMWNVVRWAMTADQLPRQDDIEARFGNPPLTVYTGRKFRVEVLFWTQAIPAIHQHGFSGAFHVMHGSSIHSLWDFQPVEQLETRLIIGRTSFRRGEILLKGDSRPIFAGNAMFHSTYHLDRPSISVVVRTLSESNKQPQYNLLPPSIAYDPFNEIATVKRQTQILQMLLTASRRTELNQLMLHLCATKDAYSVFRFLHDILDSIEDEGERENLLLLAKLKHPRLIEVLQPALVGHAIGNKIQTLYGVVSSRDLKFFLALLRNIPERASILKLVGQRFPGRDPIVAVVGFVRKLSELNVLTIRFEEPLLLMLQHLLMERSNQEIAEVFGERYGHEQALSPRELRELCSTLQTSWLLRSLCPKNPFDSDTAATTIESIPVTPDRESPPAPGPAIGECGAVAEEPKHCYERLVVDGYRCVLDKQPNSSVPRSLRSQRAPMNGHTWIVNPLLRFSKIGRCVDTDIRFSEGVTVPEPMVWVSDPVTSVISPFVLGSTLAPIVSALRPAQELAEFPASELMQQMIEGGLVYEPSANESRQSQWRSSLQCAQTKFEDGYVAMGLLLHPFTLGATRDHFRRFIQKGGAKYGDRQVARRWAAHNEPVARFILHQLTPIIEAVAGVSVKPSYVYFASYYDGAWLVRHTDREQCEYSMSMLIDYSPEPDAESPWPLWLDTKDGPIAIHQRLGDTLIYRGRQLAHYRERLPPGHTSTHLFLHYVPQNFTGSLD